MMIRFSRSASDGECGLLGRSIAVTDAVVTYASYGIGLAMAAALVEKGWHVFASLRRGQDADCDRVPRPAESVYRQG